MSNPEALFCQMAQRRYDQVVVLINSSLFFVPNVARILKSDLKFFERFVLDVVDENLKGLENAFLAMKPLSTIENFDKFQNSRKAFCQAAYACLAVREALFPSTATASDDPAWVQNIPEAVRDQLRITSDTSTYEVFEKFICKLSLRTIMDSFRAQLISELEAKLDELLVLLGINKIDSFIEKYLQALYATGIFDVLGLLDAFFECAFETCNFVETAANYKEDLSEKIQMENVGGSGWRFLENDYNRELRFKERKLRDRITSLKEKLVVFQTTEAGGSGVGPGDVFKG